MNHLEKRLTLSQERCRFIELSVLTRIQLSFNKLMEDVGTEFFLLHMEMASVQDFMKEIKRISEEAGWTRKSRESKKPLRSTPTKKKKNLKISKGRTRKEIKPVM